MSKRIKNANPTEDWYPDSAELQHLQPLSEIDPELYAAHQSNIIAKRGRPRVSARKEVVSLRLDPGIINTFRATGRGWQRRINDILLAAIQSGEMESSHP